MKKFFKFIFLSIFVLLLSLDMFAFTLRNMSSEYLKPKKITQMIYSLDMKELLEKNGKEIEAVSKIKNTLKEAGLPEEVIEEVVNSDAVKGVTQEAISSTMNYVLNGEEIDFKQNINTDSVYSFIEDNMDSIIKEAQKNNIPNSNELTEEKQKEILSNLEDKKEEVKKQVDKVAEEVEEKVKSSDAYKQMENYKEKMENVFELIRFIYSNTVTAAFIITFVILSIIILLISHSFYSYLKSFGISAILTGSYFLFLSYAISNLRKEVGDLPAAFVDFIYNVFEMIKKDMDKYGIIFIIVGVVLIILNIIIAVIKNKKEDKVYDSI